MKTYAWLHVNYVAFLATILVLSQSTASVMAVTDPTGTDTSPEADDNVHQHFHKVCVSDAECHNGGKCGTQSLGSSHHSHHSSSTTPDLFSMHKQCQCAEGYMGPACNLYCPKKCQNKGMCRLFEGETAVDQGIGTSTSSITNKREHGNHHNRHDESYRCRCVGRFTGEFCEIPFEKCPDHSRCFNGGVCTPIRQQSSSTATTPAEEDYGCKCPKGTGGMRCEVIVEEPSVMSRGKSIVTKGKGTHLTDLQVVGGLVAGIAIGIVIVAIILYGIVFVHRRRHQQRQRRQQSEEDEGEQEISLTKLTLNGAESKRKQKQKSPKKPRKKKHHELVQTQEIFEDEFVTPDETEKDNRRYRMTV